MKWDFRYIHIVPFQVIVIFFNNINILIFFNNINILVFFSNIKKLIGAPDAFQRINLPVERKWKNQNQRTDDSKESLVQKPGHRFAAVRLN